MKSFRVRLQEVDGNGRALSKYLDVTIQAKSQEDARRIAQAQFRNHKVVGVYFA
jgi:hypothetical protein